MSPRHSSRSALVLALFALWMQLLWPAMALMAAPGAMVLCTGAGAQTVPDPLAPPAAKTAHDCPCCLLQPTPLGAPPPAPAVRRAAPPAAVAFVEAAALWPAGSAYRLARGRAPPVA